MFPPLQARLAGSWLPAALDVVHLRRPVSECRFHDANELLPHAGKVKVEAVVRERHVEPGSVDLHAHLDYIVEGDTEKLGAALAPS